MGTVKRAGLWGLGGRDEQMEHGGFSGQGNYSVGYCSGGYVSSHIHQNPQKVSKKELTVL